jgi:transformation/transcription domain-associated protein
LTIRAQLNNAQKREAAKSTPQASQATQPNGTSGSPAPAQSPSQSTPRPEGQTPAESQPLGDGSANPGIFSSSCRLTVASQGVASPANGQPAQLVPRKPWEYVEEILRTLRTAYPLLIVSMEAIVDSINTRFKCPWDEDSYRLIVALLNDGISVCSLTVCLIVVHGPPRSSPAKRKG